MTEPHPEQETDPHPAPPEMAHAAEHAHGDEHEADHGEPPAGPIDWGAWLVSVVGLAAGGVVAVVIGQAIAHG